MVECAGVIATEFCLLSDPAFVPLESRPPLSMAKLIMFRHVSQPILRRTFHLTHLQAETQRRANARARTRLSQLTC